MNRERHVCRVLGVHIDAISWDEAISRLLMWGRSQESRSVAVCNAHVVVNASRDPKYRNIIDTVDMATPDGAPVAWMLRRMGFINQQRISGPDLMWLLCARAEKEHLSVYFYGSNEKTLEALDKKLNAAFPRLKIAGMESPPFRPLTKEEDAKAIERINNSKANFVFVGLGCPKQEIWMSEHRGQIHAVMLGVGAAFDFHAGTKKRAPLWMQKIGLEWFHRFLSEPRRLWKRYLITNSLFVIGAIRQLKDHKY